MVNLQKPQPVTNTRRNYSSFRVRGNESGLRDMINDLLSASTFNALTEEHEKEARKTTWRDLTHYVFAHATTPKFGKFAVIHLAPGTFEWEVSQIIEKNHGWLKNGYAVIKEWIHNTFCQATYVCWICGQHVKRLTTGGACQSCRGDGDLLWPGYAFVECITEPEAKAISKGMAEHWQIMVGDKFADYVTQDNRQQNTDSYGIVWNEWASRHGFPADAPHKRPTLFAGEPYSDLPLFEEDFPSP